MTTFFLDMDGVCCDFCNAAGGLFGLPKIDENWPIGVKKISEFLGIDTATFWNKIDEKGPEFWSEMPEYAWFVDLHTSLKLLGDVVFCSSPSLDSNSPKGKLQWLQKRFGKEFRNYVFTNKKYYLANYIDSILIDDDDEYVALFKKAGGKAILFPQSWNGNSHIRGNKVSYVIQEIYKLRKK